jgi:hypothetical protein
MPIGPLGHLFVAYPYLAVTKQDIPDQDITHQLKRYDVFNRLSSYRQSPNGRHLSTYLAPGLWSVLIEEPDTGRYKVGCHYSKSRSDEGIDRYVP